ncbi:MAG: TIGR04282 family arsenosugar biosynthesis glycosyltransferase [Deltaproteobacteria bacterium]|nr:TIGR04282 family arsenosugar biosynthesis glycosyltransferase [Deltaproteobacteria bacterium]
MNPSEASPNRIILFCKVPVAGRVKTRLIPAMGADAAADLQFRLLKRVCAELTQVLVGDMGRTVQVELRVDGAPPAEMQALVGHPFRCIPQGDGHLGHRMYRAVADAFADGVSRVVLIGADVPELSDGLILASLSALHHSDVVIGPAEDGGYYLLGMKSPQPSLFEEINWGSDTVFQETLHRIESASLTVHVLPTLYDLDRPEDVERWLAAESMLKE